LSPSAKRFGEPPRVTVLSVSREPIKPTVDFPLSEAADELTGFEIIAIEKHYGRLDTLVLGQLTVGFVWAFENRATKRTWAEIEAWSMAALNGYFAPEPVVEEDSPKPSRHDG
jgi:hypothetical protein